MNTEHAKLVEDAADGLLIVKDRLEVILSLLTDEDEAGQVADILRELNPIWQTLNALIGDP